MKISDGRINLLSRRMSSRLIFNDLVSEKNEDVLYKEIKKGFVFYQQAGEAIDKKVREKITSLKRGVPEGSSEWDILYRQYYNEEVDKM